MTPFHYAFHVRDIASTRRFYIDILRCKEGRSTDAWIDFDFFGHQLSAHVIDNIPALNYSGSVDGVSVPIPHFGCIISIEVFKQIGESLRNEDVKFIIEPQNRYQGEVGEQHTMFFLDASGNPIELKAFTNPDEIFK